MDSVLKGLTRLLHTLPAIILVTFVDVILCVCIGFLVEAQLLNPLISVWGNAHPRVVLWVAVLSAVVTQAWIVFNHKIREYIKSRSTE